MKSCIFLGLLLLPLCTHAQWSNDKTQNSTIFPGVTGTYGHEQWTTINGYQDGSVLVTWYDADTVLHVQRIDKDGFPLWEPGHLTFTGITYRGLTSLMDAQENVFLFYYKSRTGHLDFDFVFLKISPQGEKLWGNEGLVFHQPERRDNLFGFVFNTNDQGDLFFGYLEPDSMGYTKVYHRILPDGSLPWGEAGFRIDSQQWDMVFTRFLGTDNKSFYLLTGHYFGVHHDDYKYDVYLHKFDLNHHSMWDKPLMLYSGFFRGWTIQYLKGFAGDLYLSWEPSWVQHILPDGTSDWNAGGVEVITSDSIKRSVEPDLIGLTTEGNLLIFFTKHPSGPDDYQFCGQLISPEGERLWGNEGKRFGIADFKGTYAYHGSQYVTQISNDTVFMFYRYPLPIFPTHPSSVRVIPITAEGIVAWPESIEISTQRDNLSIPQATRFVNGQSIVAWTENSGSKKGVFKAQNFRTDGTIGIKSTTRPDLKLDNQLYLGYDPVDRILLFRNSGEHSTLHLRNLSGQIVWQTQVASQKSIPDLPAGIYLLSVVGSNNTIENHKILIQ